jgi:membrane fusion protein (multidrug efflux system)
LIILLVAAVGTYFLFMGNQQETAENPENKVEPEVSVHVGEITRSTLYGYIEAYGRIEPAVASGDDPPASVSIKAPAAGIVSEVKCIEGKEVQKGDLLFNFDSRISEAALKKAQENVKFEEQNLTRQKELYDVKGTSKKLLLETQYQYESALNELEKAKVELSLLQVKAPISGTIVQVFAKPAESVDMSDILAELIDTERLIVALRVPSAEVSLLKPSQKVEIETSDSQDTLPSGEVTFIDSKVDSQSDTVLVRASILSSNAAEEDESTVSGTGLKTGQFVKVRVIYIEHKNCLVVPEESLVTNPQGQTVIAIVEDDKAVQKEVQTKLHQKGLVEIESEDIHEGMQVVTTGAYGLLPETKIRIVSE